MKPERVNTNITTEGKITIPPQALELLALTPCDTIEFVMHAGKVEVVPARVETNPFRQYVGCFKAFSTQEEINNWVSDLRSDNSL